MKLMGPSTLLIDDFRRPCTEETRSLSFHSSSVKFEGYRPVLEPKTSRWKWIKPPVNT